MNCYTHHEESAIGLCKSCGRGICHECVTKVDDSLSCSGHCEEKVNTLNMMLQKNAQILTTSNKTIKSAAFFSLIFGAAFLAFGVFSYSEGSGFLPYFLIVLGLIFLVSGALRLRRSAQYPTMAIKKTEELEQVTESNNS